jgi:nitrite reductase (NADH) small subunit
VEKTLIRVGQVEDFVVGQCKPFVVENKEYLIWRTDEEFFATRNECPHQGAPLHCVKLTGTLVPSDVGILKYDMENRVIRCPWHRWEFDVKDGKTLFGTEHRRIQSFRVKVQNNEVFLDL